MMKKLIPLLLLPVIIVVCLAGKNPVNKSLTKQKQSTMTLPATTIEECGESDDHQIRGFGQGGDSKKREANSRAVDTG